MMLRGSISCFGNHPVVLQENHNWRYEFLKQRKIMLEYIRYCARATLRQRGKWIQIQACSGKLLLLLEHATRAWPFLYSSMAFQFGLIRFKSDDARACFLSYSSKTSKLLIILTLLGHTNSSARARSFELVNFCSGSMMLGHHKWSARAWCSGKTSFLLGQDSS